MPLSSAEVLGSSSPDLAVKDWRFDAGTRQAEGAHHRFDIQVVQLTEEPSNGLLISHLMQQHKPHMAGSAISRHMEVVELVDYSQEHRVRRPDLILYHV
eukprot:CAMPEP_0203885650 /NCGR_PEP_ID=MMETSP0359-20131031/29550_1 /ASSEMBLY_ACC=CAM_ASM_000338 /TAXON_ID=268821 /ORGANISM="Scrippsiella Hangoei, Strain SHTV-5" /LENGTH=98 /DNA_ID=CAMNT_0050806297 /DNA_START=66 /DNA_END=362 /DNA_ORIENTATION=+